MYIDADQPDTINDLCDHHSFSARNRFRFDEDGNLIVFSGVECGAAILAQMADDPVMLARIHQAMHDALKMHIDAGMRELKRIKAREAAQRLTAITETWSKTDGDNQPTGNSQD